MDDPEELIRELEDDIGEMEKEFREVEDEAARGTLREKQQRAEELLDEIHDQLEFLREQVKDDGKE